jgi:transposase
VSKARLVITAVVFEKRSVGEVVAEYGVSRSWVYEFVARYRAEGESAFEPRSKRPLRSPSRISDEVAALIVEVRDDLAGRGLDAGPATVCWHLEQHHGVTVSPATAHR